MELYLSLPHQPDPTTPPCIAVPSPAIGFATTLFTHYVPLPSHYFPDQERPACDLAALPSTPYTAFTLPCITPLLMPYATPPSCLPACLPPSFCPTFPFLTTTSPYTHLPSWFPTFTVPLPHFLPHSSTNLQVGFPLFPPCSCLLVVPSYLVPMPVHFPSSPMPPACHLPPYLPAADGHAFSHYLTYATFPMCSPFCPSPSFLFALLSSFLFLANHTAAVYTPFPFILLIPSDFICLAFSLPSSLLPCGSCISFLLLLVPWVQFGSAFFPALLGFFFLPAHLPACPLPTLPSP